MISKDDLLKIVTERPDMTYLEIAKEYGCTKAYVHYLANKYGIPRRTIKDYWTIERREKLGQISKKRWNEERKKNQSEFLKRAWEAKK